MLGLRLNLTVHSECGGEVGWKLVARNGRGLGASRHLYSGPDEAVASFVDLCDRSAKELIIHFHHLGSDTSWKWSIASDGETVVDASRVYARRGTCMAACNRFLDVTGRLSAQDVPAMLHLSGP